MNILVEKAWEFMEKAKKANMPPDASVVIELDVKLDLLELNDVSDCYNDMVRVMDKYEVTKSDCNLRMLMAFKSQVSSCAVDTG